MTGSNAGLIVIPIVSMLALALWLGVVMYVGAHPGKALPGKPAWPGKPKPGKSGPGGGHRTCRFSRLPGSQAAA